MGDVHGSRDGPDEVDYTDYSLHPVVDFPLSLTELTDAHRESTGK